MTKARVLTESLTAYRIGDPDGAFPIWSDEGALGAAGRWHEKASNVIYASQYYSTSMLEKLVHYSGGLPGNQHYIEISIPAGVSYEVVTQDQVKGWSNKNQLASRAFGRDWYRESRSALLIVPSIVARIETNVVFNTSHPDAAKVKVGLEIPVWWDGRLFS